MAALNMVKMQAGSFSSAGFHIMLYLFVCSACCPAISTSHQNTNVCREAYLEQSPHPKSS